jgi:CBS domain containing-hemolysin-like protein
MEIGSGILFILLGAFASYLSGILTSLTQEELSEIIEKDYNSAKILTDLKAQFERDISPFQIYEVIFYLAAGIISGFWLAGISNVLLSEVYLYLILVSIILLLRYTAQAFGIKNAGKSAHKLKTILYISNFLVSPLLWLFNKITNKIIGYEYEEASREDITQIVEEAHEEGAIDSGEYRILKNLMHLENIKVSDVMTPRTVVFSLEADITVSEAVKNSDIQMYSRFPVWQGESIDDDILGYIMTKDILQASLDGKNHLRLRDFAREISFIQENVELDNALEMFLNKRQHQFIVVDQYGGVVGLLTMEDVLEAMLGVEIVDEADRFVDLRLLAKQKRGDKFANNN